MPKEKREDDKEQVGRGDASDAEAGDTPEAAQNEPEPTDPGVIPNPKTQPPPPQKP